jgi:hypothetical protein
MQNPIPTEKNLFPQRPYFNNLIVMPHKVKYNTKQFHPAMEFNRTRTDKVQGARSGRPQGYDRQRNLLEARIKAEYVRKAVDFLASEETPTTGATLPVDGGNPAAFPRSFYRQSWGKDEMRERVRLL